MESAFGVEHGVSKGVPRGLERAAARSWGGPKQKYANARLEAHIYGKHGRGKSAHARKQGALARISQEHYQREATKGRIYRKKNRVLP